MNLPDAELDPEVALAISYAPSDTRAALATLFALDRALGQLLRGLREPMLARMRLMWWREQLVAEAHGPDPLLARIARDLIPKGVNGIALAGLVDGWDALTDAEIDEAALADYARDRGRLFGIAGGLLGASGADVQAAGECWALADLARHASDEALADRSLSLAATRAVPPRWPKRLRALGALAMLARRDAGHGLPLERQGSPARVARMLAHRLTGR